jgi:small subunit ribosomal protein S9
MTDDAVHKSPDETPAAAPAEAAPAVEAPAVKAPAVEAPAVKAPAVEAPAVKAPAPVAEKVAPVEAPPVIAEAPAPVAEPVVEVKTSLPPDAQGWWRGTGRRKAAVARVRIKPGEGGFIVNDKSMTDFFNEERDRNDLQNVLEKTNMSGSLDIHVSVKGGGYTGQAGAILLGLARAIRNYDVGHEPTLRANGYLSRDSRKVERKKPGQPGARKRFQFSKR